MGNVSDPFLIVGLGNPGKEYQFTRHNIGFLVVQQLADQQKIRLIKNNTHHALLGQGRICEQDVILLLPQTYMNRSGIAVKSICAKKIIRSENILVICDDFHLPFGQLRLRARGSHGGHNGLASVIEALACQSFARLRLGIGQPAVHQETSDFVLASFSSREKKEALKMVKEAVDCCLVFLSEKLNQAMNIFNKRKDDE